MPLVRACALADVPVGVAHRVTIDGRQIAVVNLGADGVRAVDALCSHEHYFLDEGEVDVDDGTIECPKHGSTFDLNTGSPKSLPAVRPVAVYDVKIENDDILIEV
jgi:Ferredoxin subunits of nitrite reductase and ring-hydroxylating dioxygenases